MLLKLTNKTLHLKIFKHVCHNLFRGPGCKLTFIVCLLTDMAEPIQQLTSNNQGRSQREHIPFALLARKDKVSD